MLPVVLPLAFALSAAAPPSIVYTLRVDPAVSVIDVVLRLRNVAPTVHLAMKVHAEYDARYWRFLDGVRVDGTAEDHAASVTREDSTVWRLVLPGGRGVVHYQVHVQPPASGMRRAWQTYVRTDGALLNAPDVLLYIPELSEQPVTVRLAVPRDWRVATALRSGTGHAEFNAANATTLLDSPILLGAFHEWSFVERRTTYHVVYWALPDAVPFDTLAFVDQFRRLARAATDVFGGAPTRDYWFLIQDGAGDALEHGSTVTIGVPSAGLSQDPHAHLTELAHEFFHTWNLVAIRPAGYNVLSYRPPARTPGLWFGEGATMHYADVLPRRAGLNSQPSRLDHLASLLQAYYALPAIMRVAPERASLAFGDSPVNNPDATGGYYLQGELLAEVLDAEIRAATRDQRSFDDVMRFLFAESQRPGYRGFTSRDLVAAADSVCGCGLDRTFANQVAGPGPIDPTPVLRRLGLRLLVDSVPAVDTTGRPSPDTRVGIDFTAPPGMVRLVLTNATAAFARAGLRTGDVLVAVGDARVASFRDMQNALRRLSVDDTVTMQIRRSGEELNLRVTLRGYLRPRVRFVDAALVTAADSSRRAAWLNGY